MRTFACLPATAQPTWSEPGVKAQISPDAAGSHPQGAISPTCCARWPREIQFIRRDTAPNQAVMLTRMNKPSSKDAGAGAKGKTVPKTVDEYLAAVPEPARTTLKQVRALIRSVVPKDASEAISYRIPAIQHKGALLWFAAFQKHWSLYPMGPAIVETFQKELAGYQTSKGTIRFPLDKPVPVVLVKKLVKARIAEKEVKDRRSRT